MDLKEWGSDDGQSVMDVTVAKFHPAAEPTPADVAARFINNRPPREGDEFDDVLFAVKLAEFFLQGDTTIERRHVIDPLTGESKVIDVTVERQLPFIAEFAHQIGYTELEVLALGETYPETIGRAIALSRDKQMMKIARKALAGDYNNRFAEFMSINLTELRKDGRDKEVKKKDLSSILDRIEEEGGRIKHAEIAVTSSTLSRGK